MVMQDLSTHLLGLTGIPFEHYQTQTVSTNDNLETVLIKHLLYCM